MGSDRRTWSRAGLALVAFIYLLAVAPAQAALSSLSDGAMSDVTGQALIFSNKQQGAGTSSGITFYTMGLDAQMALNANIKKMQLGCGGINGAGACDIDIDNLVLSGQPGVGGCPASGSTVLCDMVMTRPSITLAISGDNTPQRQIVGFQLSAQKVVGELTAGVNDGTANGINSMSGYFNVAATTGTTQTAADGINTATNVINGKANFGGCVAGCPAAFHTTGGTVTVPQVTGVTFNVPSFNYFGCRTAASCPNGNTYALISGISSTIPDIALNDVGPVSATIPGCVVAVILPLCGININSIGLTGTVHNLKANITLQEALGYLHVIPVNNPFSLSFEKQVVAWPGMNASYPSQIGWFMAVADPVQLGSLSTPSGYSADISSANANFAAQFSSYFNANPLQLSFSQAVGGIIGTHINVNVGTLNFGSYSAVNVPLSNLPLGTTQTPPGNCYGSSKFC
jgi:HAMP domain-containing protein